MEVSDTSSRILAALLEARTDQQLTMGRRWRIETALRSLMREHGIATLDQLIATLVTASEPGLADEVVEALLNNETYFYRDRATFDLVINGVLQRLRSMRMQSRQLRIWCAGCSTGQEAYSLAMSIAEDRQRWHGWTIDILGTDVSRAAIARCREGLYSQFEVQRGLSVRQMMRWFSEEPARQWRISSQIRDLVRFHVHSLREPVPRPGMFDLVLCRNVLLYFAPGKRAIAFARLAEGCAPGGSLVLGAVETIIGQSPEFVPDSEFRGLYVRADASGSGQLKAVG